jgi:hypothetical protein
MGQRKATVGRTLEQTMFFVLEHMTSDLIEHNAHTYRLYLRLFCPYIIVMELYSIESLISSSPIRL